MAELAIPAAAAAIAAVEFGLKFMRPDLDGIRTWLKTMQAYLRDTGGAEWESEWGRNRELQIRDLAYEIEDIVDRFKLEAPQHFHEHTVTKVLHHVAHPLMDLAALHRFSSSVKEVDAKIRKIQDLDGFLYRTDSPHGGSGSSAGPSASMAYLAPKEDELVGVDSRASALASAILEGESHLAVLLVVGPHGSGKTTVLKEVSKRLRGMFERCVWISVPSASSSNGLLQTMVTAVGGSTSVPGEMGAEDRLLYLLQNKRYALFVDGISRRDDWVHVRDLLPNDFNGSRVIISTHNKDVASYCACPSGNVFEVESLTWKESWRLLCKIAFPDGKCPDHLIEWAEKLLKRCEMLPVAVVSMGRLLSARHHTPGEFRKLHDSLGHELGGNDDLSIVGRIFLQSYYRLSHNKKCCFLYFSNFPEDYSVTRGRLIRLWIAERFVEEVRGKTLEEEAEEYLNDLIQMGLVLVSRRDFEGNVRSCRVQNLVLEFIVSKSEKEEFCLVLSGSNTTLGDKIRRLSLQGTNSGSFLMGADLSRVRSLMMFTSGLLPRKPLHYFNLLRVLDFEDANLHYFPEEIAKLLLLRHLSLRNTRVEAIPKSIGKLQSLVTLDLRQTLITQLPKEISKLRQLVYLLINHKFWSLVGVQVFPGIGQLASLQKMSLVKVERTHWNSFSEELRYMTELRKLGISGLTKEDGKALCGSLVTMRNLYSLRVISATRQDLLNLDSLGPVIPCPIRSLYLAGYLPHWVRSLGSLAKLRLQWSQMRSSQLEALRALPSLVDLKLSEDAYVDCELVVKTGWFGNLKMLELERLSMLEMVEVMPGAMPQLMRLVIRGCERLVIHPLGVENLKNLEDFLLFDMPNIRSI